MGLSKHCLTTDGLGLITAFEIYRYHFQDEGQIMEVIYSGSDPDYDPW